MEKSLFQKILQIMPVNEYLQQEDIITPLLDFAINHYIVHGDDTLIKRIIQSVAASKRKEVCLTAKNLMRIAAEIYGKKRPLLLNPVAKLDKIWKEADRLDRDEAKFVLRFIEKNCVWDRDDVEYETIQKVRSETEARERAILRKDRSMFSTTFSKGNGKTFVQGGAPGLVQQRR